MIRKCNHMKTGLAGFLLLLFFVIGVADAIYVITILPIPDHSIGDKFTISGTTDLPAGRTLSIVIYSASFIPTSKSQSGEFSGASGTVNVIQGSGGINSWSFDVDSSTFQPDQYVITVTATATPEITASKHFYFLTYTPTIAKPGWNAGVPTLGTTPTPSQTTPPTPFLTLGVTQASYGTITVTSLPAGANVYIDNIYKGLSPAVFESVPNGNHIVLLKLDGYQDFSKSVMVIADNQTVQTVLSQKTTTPTTASPQGGAPVTTLGTTPPATLGPTSSTIPQITGTIGPSPSSIGTIGKKYPIPVDLFIPVMALLCTGFLVVLSGRRRPRDNR